MRAIYRCLKRLDAFQNTVSLGVRSVFGNVRAMVADSLTPDTQATALGFISMSWGLGAVLGAHPGNCMPC